MNEGKRRLARAIFNPLDPQALKAQAAGRAVNVTKDPSLWVRARGPAADFADERVAVACLAYAMRLDQRFAAAVFLNQLRAACWPANPPAELDRACELLLAATEGEAKIEIGVAVELAVYEPAEGATKVEHAFQVGRADLSLTLQDEAWSGIGFPPRAQLLFEAKLNGKLHDIDVDGQTLPQPAAYAAAWELLKFDVEATVRVVSTIGVDDGSWCDALQRWRGASARDACSVGVCRQGLGWTTLIEIARSFEHPQEWKAAAPVEMLTSVLEA